MNFHEMISTLPVMAKGMAGIFIVTGVIILSMIALNKIFNDKN
ncbi:MAG: OadG-related small transporter subunit [Clostridiales bacterium]|nr:OadG-related small transporter subunit [Clostridiales bacterium]